MARAVLKRHMRWEFDRFNIRLIVLCRQQVPIAVSAWLAGIVGFSAKEALGGQAPAENKPQP